MAFSYTNEDLVNSIKRRALVPTSQKTFETSDFLNLAHEELISRILPLLLSVREEFYTYEDAITLVDGQSDYYINPRAIGMALNDITLHTPGGQILNIPRVSPENVRLNTSRRGSNNYEALLLNNKVRLVPTPNNPTETLYLNYHIRPGSLTPITNAMKITAIDTGTGTVTGDSVPSTLTANSEIDIVRNLPGHDYLAIDQTIQSVTTTTVVLTTLPSDLSVGDWITPCQSSPIPQVPFEFQPLLAQVTAVKVLEALGDFSGMERAEKKAMDMQESLIKLINPRIYHEPKKIVADGRFWSSQNNRYDRL